MSSSCLQLALGTRDLSQAEKETTLCKAEQIHKMETIFTRNDNFLHPFFLSCVNLLSKQLFLSQHEKVT